MSSKCAPDEQEAANLEPDDSAIYRFLQLWFANCTRGVVELGWTDQRSGKLNLFRRFALDDMAAAARFAAETNARPGCSMYFRPATVQPGPKFTRDDDVVQVPGCWADCDTTEAIERVLASDIAPTYEVVTGRIPGLRAQFLWKFSNDVVLVPGWAREINRRIHALAGGDPAVVNPSTLLRLPGSIAWPWKPARQPELTECITPPGGGHSVSLASLKAKLPQVAAEVAPNSATTTAEILNPIQALIDQTRAGPEWHNPVLKLVAMLVARGTPSTVILAMAEHLTWPKYTVKETREDLMKMIEGARRKGFGEPDVDGDNDVVDDVMNVPAKAMPDLGIWNAGLDDYQIPPRGWLLGTIFCRRFLSSLIADGGVGKTAVRMLQLISLATGRRLSGEHVFRRCRVLILSFEDDKDELRRRVHAVMKHHGIAAADLDGWLFLSAPKGMKLVVQGNKGATQTGALKQLLIDAIEKHQIDVVSLDPFIKTHGLEENDNNAIDMVCELLATIAIEYDCSVDLPHHTKKGAMAAGNADAGRGATSMKDAARLLYTLTPMTQKEAEWFGISEEERRSLIRMDSGKVNIAPPSSTAAWFRLVGVPLGNATSEYPNGDEVQTVEPWTPPSVWGGLDTPLLNRILDDLAAGRSDGPRYSASPSATTKAAWRVVVKHVPAATEEQARGVIRTWLKTGLLYEEKYDDPVDRKGRLGLWVNDAKRPS